jgi:branched-chain amino acid transport system permease protein
MRKDIKMTFEIIGQAIINGVSIGFIYSIVALGLTLIWGTMKIINFAHGDFLMMGMYTTFWIFMLIGIDPLLSLPIVVSVFFGVGLLYYRVVLRNILKQQNLTQILATFGVGIIFQSLALFFWTGDYRIISGNILSGNFRFAGIYIGIPQFVTSIICIIGIVSLFYFLNRTKTGLAIRATTLNKEAAALVGINTENIYYLVVGIGISLVGLAGSLLSNFYYIFPQIGMNFAIFAYVVIVLGGLGSLQGALVGGLLLGIITSLVGVFFDPAFKYLAVYLTYLVVVVIKPEGLGGRR